MLSKTSRLFLFASFDKDGLVSDSLIYYLSQLSKYGDVIFVMDNDCTNTELSKTKPFVIYALAERHGEYDFGSYKRAYKYALDKNILDKYDYVYLVNDSVYGPIGNGLENALIKMETSGCDFVGMISNRARKLPTHIQSWFVGISKNISLNKEFKDFMLTVSKQQKKWDIITKYEVGLSVLIKKLTHNKMYVLVKQTNKQNFIYNKPWLVIERGVPFLKKIAIRKTISYDFLQKLLHNDMFFDEIKRSNIELEHRPFAYFCWCISQKIKRMLKR